MTLTLTLVSPDPAAPGLDARIRDTRALLERHGLRTSAAGAYLVTPDGGQPVFDDHPLHLEMSWLGEGARGIYATVWEARPGPELCGLVFALAEAAQLLVTPTPAPPHIIACGEHFADDDIVDESVPPSLEIAVRAHTPADLYGILTGDWRRHRITYADRYWS